MQMMFANDRYGRLLMETLAFLGGLSQLRIRNHRYLIGDVKVNGVEQYLNRTPLRNTD